MVLEYIILLKTTVKLLARSRAYISHCFVTDLRCCWKVGISYCLIRYLHCCVVYNFLRRRQWPWPWNLPRLMAQQIKYKSIDKYKIQINIQIQNTSQYTNTKYKSQSNMVNLIFCSVLTHWMFRLTFKRYLQELSLRKLNRTFKERHFIRHSPKFCTKIPKRLSNIFVTQ